MFGYSPKIPLIIDTVDGIALTKTIKEVVQQNLKMLILTNPGERIMMPDFGVGPKRILFQQKDANISGTITSKINQQVTKYLPFLTLDFVNVEPIGPESDVHTVSIRIGYTIGAAGDAGLLDLNVTA